MKKYIKEWEDAIMVETRGGEHGISHICVNDLFKDEQNTRQKEYISELVYDILYRQAQNQASRNLP